MRHLVLLIILISTNTFADNTIYPKDAIKYLAELDCSFSAFASYTGPDAGILRKGQAFTNAICAASYAEGGAKSHDFCWLRPVDMKKGVYLGRASYGSSWRDESGPCTKDTIEKILSTPSVRNEVFFGAGVNKEWSIVTDKKDVSEKFKSFLKGQK